MMTITPSDSLDQSRPSINVHNAPVDVTIVLPVYNEADTLVDVIEQLLTFIDTNVDFRIAMIVVDDGSSDNSRQIAESYSNRLTVLYHTYNQGYGAALTTGAISSDTTYILSYDADGQHTLECLQAVLRQVSRFDMVIGARRKCNADLSRNVGRSLVRVIAGYLVGRNIPDLNSGLRLIDRKKFLEFAHLYPRGFSISSTATLAFIKRGYSVGFVPISIERRKGGHSTVNVVRDGMHTISVLIHLIMLFSPQKIFLPIAVLLFILGGTSFVIEAIHTFNIGENTVILLISSVLVFLFGLLGDQIAAIRRELRRY